MPTHTDAPLNCEELERRWVAPFVQRHFPHLPKGARPRVTLVKAARTLIAPEGSGRLPALPAQYSFTYTHEQGELRQVVCVLADAHGAILRVLTSK